MKLSFNKRQKKHLFRILLTAALSVAALLFTLIVKPLWWVTLLVILPIYLYIGYDVLWAALSDIGHGQIFGEKFLMALATVGALVLSEYIEALAVMLFFQIGELFESLANASARKSLTALASLCPDEATVLKEDGETVMPIDEVAVGDVIAVRVGERVPLDGVIVKGEATVDYSSLTGEALPVFCREEDSLPAGAVILDAPLVLKVEKTAEHSATARILTMMEDALAEKGAHERFITKFSHVYTPIVVISALVVAFLFPLFSHTAYLAALPEYLRRALNFLVVSCPCAMVISLPLSFFSASGRAAKQGIIFKSNAAIEKLATCKVACFDKTGTLTNGNFSLVKVEAGHKTASKEALTEIAAALESGSIHPLAAAFSATPFDQALLSEVKEDRGRGVSGRYRSLFYRLGSYRYLEENGVSGLPEEIHVGSVLYLAEDTHFLAAFFLEDTPKEDAASLVKALDDLKIEAAILSGDRHETVLSLAESLGFSKAIGSLLPEDKVAAITALKEKGTVVFAGDGINDAPSMAAADVSFAMGALGSDAAMEAADAVICDDRPEKVPFAISLSRFTMVLVKENLYVSIGIKLLVLLLSAFGYANLWLAVFADVGVLILAILNAMRALKYQE